MSINTYGWRHVQYFEEGWNAAKRKNVEETRASLGAALIAPSAEAAFSQGVAAGTDSSALQLTPEARARLYDSVKALAEVLNQLPPSLSPAFTISNVVQDQLWDEAQSRKLDCTEDFAAVSRAFSVQFLGSIRDNSKTLT